jgi:hypothetical protein
MIVRRSNSLAAKGKSEGIIFVLDYVDKVTTDALLSARHHS